MTVTVSGAPRTANPGVHSGTQLRAVWTRHFAMMRNFLKVLNSVSEVWSGLATSLVVNRMLTTIHQIRLLEELFEPTTPAPSTSRNGRETACRDMWDRRCQVPTAIKLPY